MFCGSPSSEEEPPDGKANQGETGDTTDNTAHDGSCVTAFLRPGYGRATRRCPSRIPGRDCSARVVRAVDDHKVQVEYVVDAILTDIVEGDQMRSILEIAGDKDCTAGRRIFNHSTMVDSRGS